MLYRTLGVVQGRARTDLRDCVGIEVRPPWPMICRPTREIRTNGLKIDHGDHPKRCPLLGVRHTHIDITRVFDVSASLPPRLPPGRICPLFAKHSPPMLLAHFIGDARSR